MRERSVGVRAIFDKAAYESERCHSLLCARPVLRCVASSVRLSLRFAPKAVVRHLLKLINEITHPAASPWNPHIKITALYKYK